MDPVPLPNEDDQARCNFLEDWPLLAAVVDARSQEEAAEAGQQSLDLPVSQVKLYSLKRHIYIHTISIPGKQCTQQWDIQKPGYQNEAEIDDLLQHKRWEYK